MIASNGTYEITPVRTYGIFLAVLTSTTAVNIWGNKILGKWNTAACKSFLPIRRQTPEQHVTLIANAVYWSISGAVIISIVLLAMADKTDPAYVFTSFENQTGWPDGLSWILGLLQSALSLIAFDVVLHMTEEMPNPRRDCPRALIYSIAVGGVT